MRYRTASATALATIALAAGGFLASTGTAIKSAAGADLRISASGSGNLDLWSTLPDGRSAAARAQLAADDNAAAGSPAYRGMLPPEPTVEAPPAAAPAEAIEAPVQIETPAATASIEPPEDHVQTETPTIEQPAAASPDELAGAGVPASSSGEAAAGCSIVVVAI